VIVRTVNSDLQPMIRLQIVAADGTPHEVEGMVDTGLNGWLTLPSNLIAALGLLWKRRGRAILADGSTVLFDIYEATVLWDSRPVLITVDEADGLPLIGMSLMQGYAIFVHAIDGGSVTIRDP
jgi:clan AA aspartic protease